MKVTQATTTPMIQRGRRRARFAIQPHFQRPVQIVGGCSEIVDALCAEYQVVCSCSCQRMAQRLTRDVGVDQGSRDAELPKPHPAAEILRPILHQERDDISSTQAQLKGPVCDLVGFFVYVPVRHAPIFEQHERVITVCGRFFL